jgi:uridine nucleosidase
MYAALTSCAPGTAWVVATGAFTNAAALFQTHPDLIPHIAGLSLMGGAVGGGFTPAVLGVVQGVPRIGNWTQFAEFNILADPEAAAWIFDTKSLASKTTLIPLDVTHLVLATEEVQKLLLWGKEGGVTHAGEGLENAALGAKSTLRLMLVELLFYFAKTYR